MPGCGKIIRERINIAKTSKFYIKNKATHDEKDRKVVENTHKSNEYDTETQNIVKNIAYRLYKSRKSGMMVVMNPTCRGCGNTLVQEVLR